MMILLQRRRDYPGTSRLSPADLRHVEEHFSTYGGEFQIDGDIIAWNALEEVEIARAPGISGLVGGLVKRFVHGGDDRYHLALYYGFREAVLHDISLEEARYILENVAYYAPHPIRYYGPDGIIPTVHS